MLSHPPLTRMAHAAVSDVLVDGALAIDATVGNGHDSLFLARAVAPSGHVYGFDIQAAALVAARERLAAAAMEATCTLCETGHEQMASQVPADWRGRVSAIMFNLGYLPGGDKTVITRAATTRAAIDQAAQLLRPGGMISLLQYRGHGGAEDEVAAVDAWVAALPDPWRVQRHASPGPVLYLLHKHQDRPGYSRASR